MIKRQFIFISRNKASRKPASGSRIRDIFANGRTTESLSRRHEVKPNGVSRVGAGGISRGVGRAAVPLPPPIKEDRIVPQARL